jgi:hypothetical protein
MPDIKVLISSTSVVIRLTVFFGIFDAPSLLNFNIHKRLGRTLRVLGKYPSALAIMLEARTQNTNDRGHWLIPSIYYLLNQNGGRAVEKVKAQSSHS